MTSGQPGSEEIGPPSWVGSDSRRLGRYVVGPVLGQGGMGVVHEAWDTLLRRRVALKRLTQSSPEAWVRFLQEGQFQARLRHPSICQIYDADTVEDLPVIAMQLIHGEPLSDLRPRINREDLLRILMQVALAVHAAHQAQILHRDLKPGNILVEEGPEGFVPFVCDFGLARDLSGQGITQTHHGLGTLGFMAPEQLHPHLPLSPATDVYGMGATLHAMLLGQAPEPAIQGQLSIDRLGSGEGWDDLPRDIQTMLAKALEWDPKDRYPSAAAFAEDLRRFLEGEPLVARPLGWMGRVQRRIAHRPGLATTAALGLLAAVALLGWGYRTIQFARKQAQAAQRLALDTKDVEHLLRLERMRPLHDMRPAYAEIRLRMVRLEGTIKGLGRAAEGPGHYALGRGYMAVGDSKRALSELQEAWRKGFQVPDVAYALGRAHCDLFWEASTQAGFNGDTARMNALRKEHMGKALWFFGQAGGQSFESPDLALARIERVKGHADTALALARKAFEADPWEVEAKTSEASALARLGFDQMIRGEYGQAWDWFRKAEAASRQARELARSDEGAYQTDLNWRLAWAGSTLEHGEIDPRFMEQTEELCRQQLSINPENPESVANLLWVQVLKAWALLNAGKDPSAVIGHGLELYRSLTSPTVTNANIKVAWMEFHRLTAEWDMRNGRDPSMPLKIAVGDGGHSDYRLHDSLAEALLLKARWDLSQGRDPSPVLDRMEPATEGLHKRRVVHGYLDAALGEAQLIRAGWAMKQGQDSQPFIEKAESFARKSLDFNPKSVLPYCLLAKIQSAKANQPGADRRRWVEEERTWVARGLAIKPGYWPLFSLGRSSHR
ncbi:serine/threonine-protein kinase [Geothrix fermentans]|uniref:serine/threonine-protein kinase n=1 Tax=Geothrix fermentans TaxID=44676 RepID=UPI000A016EAE|nr:serine/threonine-protein kinase [Geothrix fermentans]